MEKSLPSRKKNRLEKWLYNSGYFFVTICTHNKISYFGDIDVGADTIRLNKHGKIIEEYLYAIPFIHPHVTIEMFVIMPNHIHTIFSIEKIKAIDNRPYGMLSKVIKGFKQISTKQLRLSCHIGIGIIPIDKNDVKISFGDFRRLILTPGFQTTKIFLGSCHT